MTQPRKILIVRLSHLGDVVHALPVFHALREAYPSAEFGWAIQPEFAGLIEGLPGLQHIFHFGRQNGLAAWFKLRRELRDWSPDMAVDCQGNLKSAAVTRLSGASRRVGYHRYDWREQAGARILTETAQRVTTHPIHALDRVNELARHFVPDVKLRTDLALSQAELEHGDSVWQKYGGKPDALVIHLSTQSDVRSWPTASAAQLASAAAEQGREVLILSGPSELEEGKRLATELADSTHIHHWVGQTGLRELAAFFQSAAKANAQLVACDSGPMHLAVACGLPVICLEGPQDADRTGPRQLSQVAPAIQTQALRASETIDCAPCLKRSCNHAEGPICMTRIQPEQVLKALQETALSGKA